MIPENYDKEREKLHLFELSICYETNFEKAEERKLERFSDLICQLEERIETSYKHWGIGSRRVVPTETIDTWKSFIGTREAKNLGRRIPRIAINTSFVIWTSRNRKTWNNNDLYALKE